MANVYIPVTRDQIRSAQALIRLRGGEDKVDEDIRLIANAQPLTPEQRAEYEATR